jgi:uncharacterized protein YajQ (UPF0234 family)
MPSFDIVSEIDMHELSNAVDQTNREVGNRFDFKGSDATVEQGSEELTLKAQNEFQLNQMRDILYQKMTKRGIELTSLEEGQIAESGKTAQQKLKLRLGIDKEFGKKITQLIKESKIKVQTSIQGDTVRVTGKKRDDLQECIALLRKTELGQPLQFNNFRD